MLLVPELRAERMILEHVDVVHALGRKVAEVFDNGAVGSLQIGEAALADWFNAFRLGLGDLRARQPKRGAGRPGVAADQDRAAFVRRVEWEVRDVRPRLVGFKALARVDDMPAEMPDRGLRRGRRRRGDLAEQDQHVGRRLQRGEAAPRRFRRAGKLPDVEIDSGVRIDGIEMQMMEAWRCEHGVAPVATALAWPRWRSVWPPRRRGTAPWPC